MSRFGFDTTTDELVRDIRLDGSTVLITGGSGGLGEETARALAAAGARTLIAARDEQRAQTAIDRIRERHPDADVAWHHVDLASLSSVRQLADHIRSSYERLDVLIANAGIMGGRRRTSDDGFELQFAVNYLAHFVLTVRLVPLLVTSAPSRVVIVSSAGHAMGGLELDDLNFERRSYDGLAAYGQAKTAGILFAVELDRRLRDRGVRAVAVHPGAIRTDLGRDLTAEDTQAVRTILRARQERLTWKTVEQGAATQVWAATLAATDDVGGGYLEDCGIASINPDNQGSGPGVLPRAVDPDRARELWRHSEELTGEELCVD